MPQTSRTCGVPARSDLANQARNRVGIAAKSDQRGSLPFQWVAADELYGDSPAFRDGVAEMNKWYFTEIKCTTLIWRSRPEVHIPRVERSGSPSYPSAFAQPGPSP